MQTFKQYLEALITEKGQDLDNDVEGLENEIFGPVIGFTYQNLVDALVDMKEYAQQIKTMLVKIDFKNGDVFHYLKYLANGIVNA